MLQRLLITTVRHRRCCHHAAWRRPWRPGGASPLSSRLGARERCTIPDTEIRVTGIVEAVNHVTGPDGACCCGAEGGTHVTLKTAAASIDAHLGPTVWLREQGIAPAAGDTVEILGSRVTMRGPPCSWRAKSPRVTTWNASSRCGTTGVESLLVIASAHALRLRDAPATSTGRRAAQGRRRSPRPGTQTPTSSAAPAGPTVPAARPASTTRRRTRRCRGGERAPSTDRGGALPIRPGSAACSSSLSAKRSLTIAPTNPSSVVLPAVANMGMRPV